MGRRSARRSTLSGASSAARGFGRAAQQRQDVEHAEETLDALQEQLEELNAEFQSDTAELEEMLTAEAIALETTVVKPRRADVDIQLVSLVWVPYWQDELGGRSPAWT
jgi:hypothetical protein